MTTRPIWTRVSRWLSVGGVLLAVLAPAVAAAEEPTIEQIEYHPAELPPDAARGRVILVGLALTAGWYGAAVGTSYLWPDAPNASDLRLPVVGPWMALGNTGCGSDESRCSTLTVVGRTALAVVSGVGQAGGVLALVEGIFMSTGSSPAPAPAASGLRGVGREAAWAAVPVALPDGAGIEFVGSF